MHPYVPHLLSDIAAAHRVESPSVEDWSASFEQEMEEIERWVEAEEPVYTFGHYCKLESINFPPAEQLCEKDIRQILQAFTQMMSSWNLFIDLPESLPLRVAYKMTIDTLDRGTAIVNCGMVGFDFCTGYTPDCVFREYCPCLKIWNNNRDKDVRDY